MSDARGWTRSEGSTNGEGSRLKRIALACLFVVIGVIGAGALAFAAPSGSFGGSDGGTRDTRAVGAQEEEVQYL